MAYWGGSCAVTGTSDAVLLRASHRSRRDSDAERLDVHNDLLLAAHLDAAFDKGLISFAEDGTMMVSDLLSPVARMLIAPNALPKLCGLTEVHGYYLGVHRAEVPRRAQRQAAGTPT
jgi:putative restriction endonuclease